MADAEELKDNIASEVHVKRFTEKELGIQNVGAQFKLHCPSGTTRSAEDGPNRRTTSPSRLYSNVVEDVSGCFLGEEDDGSDLTKEQKDAMRNTWSTSGNFMYRHHVMNRENYMCFETDHFLFH